MKKDRGITLVALAVTIIILLILAGVSISMLAGENGILQRAANAKQANTNAEDFEKVKLASQAALTAGYGKITDFSKNDDNKSVLYQELGNSYQGNGIAKLNKTYTILTDGNVIEGMEISTVIDNGSNTEISFNENTNIIDDYGNCMILPTGFKITNITSKITDGVVIEDITESQTKGSQFVWVPVGDIKKADGTIKTISLSGCNIGNSYGTLERRKDDVTQNAHAKDIEGFISSSKSNYGYYIGRYEAGIAESTDNASLATPKLADGTVKPIIKSGLGVWNKISQTEASVVSGLMYNSDKFTSDLTNSYAWDTAISFEEVFGTNPNYSNQGSIQGTLAKTGEATNGTNNDVQCNIYDMAGNIWEWSTLTHTVASLPGYDATAVRGGIYATGGYHCNNIQPDNYSSKNQITGFRPIIYF